MKFFKKIQTAIKNFFFSSREERLEKAIRDNNEKSVKSLLREGDGRDPKHPFLHMAADIGNEKIVDLILKRGKVDINVLNKFGESALHVAVKDGNDKVAELLIKNGININLLDSNGYSALHDAIFKQNESQPILFKGHQKENDK
jgi:ankyrin repeat protein